MKALEHFIQSDLWRDFENQTKAVKRQPIAVMAELVRDYLERVQDQKLLDEMRRDARASGYRASDAVKLVRAYRKEKKSRHAAP